MIMNSVTWKGSEGDGSPFLIIDLSHIIEHFFSVLWMERDPSYSAKRG